VKPPVLWRPTGIICVGWWRFGHLAAPEGKMRPLPLAFMFALLAVMPGCVVAGSSADYGYGYGNSGYARPYYAPAPVYRPVPVYRPYYAPAPVYRPRYVPVPVYRSAPSRPAWVHRDGGRRDHGQRSERRRGDGGWRGGEHRGREHRGPRRESRNEVRQEQ
jgi:hypothetical protein